MRTASAVLAWRRRVAAKPDPTIRLIAEGGPFDRQPIVLRDNCQRTLDFVVRDFRGSYEVVRSPGKYSWRVVVSLVWRPS